LIRALITVLIFGVGFRAEQMGRLFDLAAIKPPSDWSWERPSVLRIGGERIALVFDAHKRIRPIEWHSFAVLPEVVNDQLKIEFHPIGPYLFQEVFFSSPRLKEETDGLIVRGGSAISVEDALGRLADDELAATLLRLRFIPEDQFEVFLKTLRSHHARAAVKEWLTHKELAAQLQSRAAIYVAYWATHANREALVGVANTPAAAELALELIGEARDADAVKLMAENIEGHMQYLGLADYPLQAPPAPLPTRPGAPPQPPPPAFNYGIDQYERWKRVQTVTLPRIQQALRAR
jgi:hypothetical protein